MIELKTKTQALALFGDKQSDAITALIEAIGDISRSAIYQWPEELPPRVVDRVIAAALRTGRLPRDAA